MTREEALLKIGELILYARTQGWDDVYTDAFKILERESMLDKIRAEIEQAADKQFQIAMGVADLNERYAHIQMENAYRHSLNVIDKCRAESEPQESEVEK